jgi:hypothetical protein
LIDLDHQPAVNEQVQPLDADDFTLKKHLDADFPSNIASAFSQ